MCRKLIIICLALVLVSSSYADVVIGNWENATDGWISWGDGQKSIGDPTLMPSKYSYSTDWSSLDTYSLKLVQSGWNQNLSIKLQDNGLVDEFMANSKLLIDLHLPATTQSGWEKIEEIVLNAEGISWGQIKMAGVVYGWGDGGGGAINATLEFDYSAYFSDPDVIALGRNPNWAEFIIATNNDGNAEHLSFYFDNARLVPEPATVALLGLGGLAMLRRKRS